METLNTDPILEFKTDSLQAIRASYNLDQRRVNEAIDRIEEWMAKQHHFVKKDFSRTYIERALMQAKGSVEKTKSTIEKLCTLKTLLPNFFKNCDVKTELRAITKMAWLIPLPKMTDDYYRVFMIKINAKEFTSAHFMEYFRLNIVIFEYLKDHDYVKGFVVIDDYRDVNLLDIITKMNIVELQQFIAILIQGYGARILGIHILTESKVVDLFISTLKQFVPTKIGNRLFIHSTIESLYNVVDKDILPVEYGGKEMPIAELNRRWLDVISTEKHMEYMKVMNAACTDESLRSKEEFNKEYLGLPGTFRTLNVD